jgi:hypothetical protein
MATVEVYTKASIDTALAGKASISHAATHASAGSDPITIAQSQVTGLVAALDAVMQEGDLFVNVKDYGAVGDDSTDDYAEITAAIAACPRGGTVFFPPGKYRISQQITVPPRTTLQGTHAPRWPQYAKEPTGISSCIKPTASAFTSNAIIRIIDDTAGGYTETYTSAIRLIDITLDGEDLDGAGSNPIDGIYSTGEVIDVSLHRVCIHNMSGNGVHTDTNATGHPKGWVFDGSYMQSSAGYAYKHENTGAASFAITDATYIGCWGGANEGGGWYWSSVLSADLISCRSEFNTGHGYEVYGSSRIRFINCDTDRNTKDGFHIESKGSGVRSVQLVGCIANRDGANDDVTPAGYAGFNILGATGGGSNNHNPVTMVGCVVNTNRNDAGAGIYSPDYGLKISYAPQISTSGCHFNGTVASILDNQSQLCYDNTTRFNVTNPSTGTVTLEQANTHRIIGLTATNRDIEFWTSTSGKRWVVRASSTTEAGSNAGTNFNINRYDDAGVSIDTPFSIDRATGVVSLTTGLKLASLTSDPSPTPNSGSVWYRSDTGELRARINSLNGTLHQGIKATATLDFSSIAAGATSELTITATGAATGDPVSAGPPSTLNTGLNVTVYVSATNTVTVRLHNSTGSAIDPASSSWSVMVHK